MHIYAVALCESELWLGAKLKFRINKQYNPRPLATLVLTIWLAPFERGIH